MLDSDVNFPILRSLSVRPSEPQDHNASLIQKAGMLMEEAGEKAFCPASISLAASSAAGSGTTLKQPRNSKRQSVLGLSVD